MRNIAAVTENTSKPKNLGGTTWGPEWIQGKTKAQIEAILAERAQAEAPREQPCSKCYSTGTTELVNLMDLASKGVLADKIPWCDCAKAKEQRGFYEQLYEKIRQRQLEKAFQYAGIPDRLKGLRLETVQDMDGKKYAVQAALLYLRDGAVDGKTSLLFHGAVGVGKSAISAIILSELVNRGMSGLWIDFHEFIAAIQAGYTDGTSEDKLRAAKEAGIVVIDDLGDLTSNGQTEDRRRIIYRLISDRHKSYRPTIITSNLDSKMLVAQFGLRTFDRIKEMMAVIGMWGENMRGEVLRWTPNGSLNGNGQS